MWSPSDNLKAASDDSDPFKHARKKYKNEVQFEVSSASHDKKSSSNDDNEQVSAEDDFECSVNKTYNSKKPKALKELSMKSITIKKEENPLKDHAKKYK